MSNAIDILVLSKDPGIIAHCEKTCTEFQYEWKQASSFQNLIENPCEAKFVFASQKIDEENTKLSEIAQGLRFAFPESFITTTIGSSLQKEEATFARKSGVDLIILEEEVTNTSKLSYAMNQIIRANFLPIKAIDLVPNAEIPFDVYHLMPQRSKFIKYIFAGDTLNEKKYSKTLEVKEVYIHRLQASKYDEFVRTNNDTSSNGLAKRCRSNFLALYAEFNSLVLMLTDQSEVASYGEGLELLHRCQSLCKNMLSTLAEFPNAWEIINGSAIGEFGSVERSPAIAAYTGLLGLQLNIPNLDQVMLMGLLTDLGLLFLSPEITKKIRTEGAPAFTEEEEKEFRKYPAKSLEVVLNRKLSVDEKNRQLMQATNERVDGKGFPKGLEGKRVSDAAQLIRYCREFDKRSLIRLGKTRVNPVEAMKNLVSENLGKGSFDEFFLANIKDIVMKI